MKAAFAPKTDDKHPNAIDVDIEYLLTDDSEVSFDWFERIEKFPHVPSGETWTGKLIGIFIAALMLAILVFAVIGVVSVVK